MTIDDFVIKESWNSGYAAGCNEQYEIINAAIKQFLLSYIERDDRCLAKGISLLLSICESPVLDEEMNAALKELLESNTL